MSICANKNILKDVKKQTFQLARSSVKPDKNHICLERLELEMETFTAITDLYVSELIHQKICSDFIS